MNDFILKNVNECSGIVLNYLVAICENENDNSMITNGQVDPITINYLDPNNAFKIIERECISTTKFKGLVDTGAFGVEYCTPFWIGVISTDFQSGEGFWVEGSDMIEAAMRCYVANKLHTTEISIPKIIWKLYLNNEYGNL